MNYTIQELDEAIEEGFTYTCLSYDGGVREIESEGWGELNEALFWSRDAVVNLPEIGIATGVEDHGGGEGSGEERWFVFSITDPAGNVRLFRRNGYYASFHGSDFDGPTEAVVPVRKTITVYEAIPDQ